MAGLFGIAGFSALTYARPREVALSVEAVASDDTLNLAEEIERQRHELNFAELALAEKEKQINAMFERLDAAKVFARNARRLQEIAARRFEELFHGIPVACFTCDLDGVVFDCSRCAETLWSVSSHEAMQQSIFQLMSGGERSPELANLLDRVANKETIEQEEFEIRVRGDETRWVLAHIFPLLDSEGANTGSVWALIDDTDRKLHATRLQESETRLRTSLESMQSGVMIFDKSGQLNISNPRAMEILGWADGSLNNWVERYDRLNPINRDGRPVEKLQMPLFRALNGETCHDLTLGLSREDGQQIWISVNSAPMIGADSVMGAVVSFVDISQQLANEETIHQSIQQIRSYSMELEAQAKALEEANHKLESLASTDGLTGIKNQRSYNELLETHFYNAARYDQDLSLLSLDVDFFKSFNDEFGHPAGDEVLRQVAAILTHEARAGDFVARCGGEEFAVVLPNTGSTGALEAAERVRASIAGAKWPHRVITVSVGVATRNSAHKSYLQLVQSADQALYRSKFSGRNRVTHANQIDAAA